jgi:hypothetical protein
VEGNPVHIRWKNHKKFVLKGIRFRPEYAELIDRLSEEKGVCQREVIEEALKGFFGEPKE